MLFKLLPEELGIHMKKHTKLLIMTLLSCCASAVFAKDYGLHFDDQGKIIQPDQAYLSEGLKDEQDGYPEDAYKNFMKSAEFGNLYAMSLVGFYHLKNKELTKALAWFNLVDSDKIPNSQMIEQMKSNLEQVLTEDELKASNKMQSELVETYGSYPTLVRRESWKNNLKFTGTHIKGHIPAFLTFNLNSGVSVSGFNVKKQVEQFIYNYEFDPNMGEVTLEEFEVVEGDQSGSDEVKK